MSEQTYDVVLMVELTLSEQDARQVRSLHEALPDEVHYTVLHPVEDAATRVASAMGTLGAGGDGAMPQAVAAPAPDAEEVQEIQEDLSDTARAVVDGSVAALTRLGGHASGQLVTEDAVDGLVAKVEELHAAEVIVLTSPHVVKEFFHLDWSSQAQRRLGVPVLHLLERETFDEQAGSGEGVTGL